MPGMAAPFTIRAVLPTSSAATSTISPDGSTEITTLRRQPSASQAAGKRYRDCNDTMMITGSERDHEADRHDVDIVLGQSVARIEDPLVLEACAVDLGERERSAEPGKKLSAAAGGFGVACAEEIRDVQIQLIAREQHTGARVRFPAIAERQHAESGQGESFQLEVELLAPGLLVIDVRAETVVAVAQLAQIHVAHFQREVGQQTIAARHAESRIAVVAQR